ncbi:hypothetical protein IG631_14632 [Alternaria alternata]|nr:hypothetical protein IG631_14632 [Alternaria alternata]
MANSGLSGLSGLGGRGRLAEEARWCVCDQHETRALSIYSVRSEWAQRIDGGSRGKYWQMWRKFCMGADVHRYLTTGLGLGAA